MRVETSPPVVAEAISVVLRVCSVGAAVVLVLVVSVVELGLVEEVVEDELGVVLATLEDGVVLCCC